MPGRSGRSASDQVSTYCGRNSAVESALRLALFASCYIILLPLHRGTWMRSRFTRLAVARKVLECQNLIFQQLWHLHMKSALLLAPTLTHWTCHPEVIEKTIDEFGGRGTGIVMGLNFYRHELMRRERNNCEKLGDPWKHCLRVTLSQLVLLATQGTNRVW